MWTDKEFLEAGQILKTMTKRDYVAALALQGILANNGGMSIKAAAIDAVRAADALIAELEKKNND